MCHLGIEQPGFLLCKLGPTVITLLSAYIRKALSKLSSDVNTFSEYNLSDVTKLMLVCWSPFLVSNKEMFYYCVIGTKSADLAAGTSLPATSRPKCKCQATCSANRVVGNQINKD